MGLAIDECVLVLVLCPSCGKRSDKFLASLKTAKDCSCVTPGCGNMIPIPVGGGAAILIEELTEATKRALTRINESGELIQSF